MQDFKQKKYDETGRLPVDENLSLYRHAKSPFVFADYRLGKVRTRRSTKTKDLAMAEKVARRTAKTLKQDVQTGKTIAANAPTVGDLLNAYRDALEKRVWHGEASVKIEISVLSSNIMPYWENVPLADLSRQHFYAWEDWRKARDGSTTRTYSRGGKKVTASVQRIAAKPATLAREKNYFVGALDWGCNQLTPWLTDERVHEIRQLPRRKKGQSRKHRTDERRFALSRDQIERLFAEFRRWDETESGRAAKGRSKRNFERRLMACHVRFLLASGLRPGTEILDLTWGCLKTRSLANGTSFVVIDECGNGKSGPRIVNCNPESISVVQDLKLLLQEQGFATSDDATLWPSARKQGAAVQDFNGSFQRVIAKLGFDKRVRDQPLYICRHTYITDRLRSGVSDKAVARNCGTSTEMIDRHYDHLQHEDLPNLLNPSSSAKELKLPVGPTGVYVVPIISAGK